MSDQWRWLLVAVLSAAIPLQIARSADPPAQDATNDTIATKARAVGLTVKHDAEEFAKAVKEQAKKVGAAAQQGAKEIQTTVVHQVKIGDDDKKARADKAAKTDKTHETDKNEDAKPPK